VKGTASQVRQAAAPCRFPSTLRVRGCPTGVPAPLITKHVIAQSREHCIPHTSTQQVWLCPDNAAWAKALPGDA